MDNWQYGDSSVVFRFNAGTLFIKMLVRIQRRKMLVTRSVRGTEAATLHRTEGVQPGPNDSLTFLPYLETCWRPGLEEL